MSTDGAATRIGLVTGHQFGLAAGRGAVAAGANLRLVIGLSDSRQSATVGFRPTIEFAETYGADYVETTDGSLATHASLISDAALDILFVVGWSRLVSDSVLQLFSRADGKYAIGMHPTLLPEGRGRAPIPWTILKGLRSTGLTAFRLAPGADTGEIICQLSFPVSASDRSGTLVEILEPCHGYLASLIVGQLLRAGDLPMLAQDETAATVWPKRIPADSEIRDGMTIDEIERLIRAASYPYPEAFYRHGADLVVRSAIQGRLDEGNYQLSADPVVHVYLEKSDVTLVCLSEGSAS